MRRLKIYILSNYDGVNAAMVGASSLLEAGRLMHMSEKTLRAYGFRHGDDIEDVEAMRRPRVVFYRPIGATHYPWSETPYRRVYHGWPNSFEVNPFKKATQ